MEKQRDKKWIGAAIGLVSQGIGLVANLISKNKQAKAEQKARQEQLALEAKQKAEEKARQRNQMLNDQYTDTSYIDEFQKRIEFEGGGDTKIKNKVNNSNADFVKRLKDKNRKFILDWSENGKIATHKLSVGTDNYGNHYIYADVKNINNKLIDYTRPPYNNNISGLISEQLGDTVRIGKTDKDLKDAIKFTENYKEYYDKGNTFKKGGNIKNDIPPTEEIKEIYEEEEPLVESPLMKVEKREEPIILTKEKPTMTQIKPERKLSSYVGDNNVRKAEEELIANKDVWEKNINDWLINSPNYRKNYINSLRRNDPKGLQMRYRELDRKNVMEDYFNHDQIYSKNGNTVDDVKTATINNLRSVIYRNGANTDENKGGYYDPNKHEIHMRIENPEYIAHEYAHASNAMPQEAAITQYIIDNYDKFKNLSDPYWDSSSEIYGRLKQFKEEHNLKAGEKISKEQLQNLKKNTKNTLNFTNRYDDDSLLFFLNEVAKNDNKQNTLNLSNFPETFFAKNGGKIKHKIEAENGEIIKSDKPMIIRNGGIAIPLGNGYNLLKGKTHEQGGIDIDLKGDGRVWSDVPFLNGESPARKVLKGENPNKVFIQQEMFKKVNDLEDDGSRKKQMGDYVTKNKRKNKINDLIYYATKGYDTELSDNVNTAIGDYDNTTTGRLINYVENSDSLGYKDGKWYSPKVTHPRAKVDNNNFGMGVDKKQNPYIKDKIKKDSKRRQYITENDERDARYKSMRDAKESAKQRYDYARKITKSDNELSNIKKAITESAIYNLGSGYVAKNLFNDKKLINTLMNGTDEEYNNQVNKYYKKKERNDRINKTNEFLNLKRMGGKMENNSLIYNLNGNVKNKNGFVSSTGKRQKAELGIGGWNAIGQGIVNIGGSLASYFMNRKALKDMENMGIGSGPEAPVAMQATKLNTNYNINPQLSAIKEAEANAFKDIDQNTTSSSVALARKQQARLNSIQNRNALYAEKENKETELINADRLNQQQVSAQNNQMYNQYLKDKYNHQLKEHEFKLGLIDKRGENNTALIQNLTGAIGGVGNYFTKKESDDKYMKFLKEVVYAKRYGSKTKR